MTERTEGADMAMLVIAGLLGLSLALILTAKIVKMLDMSYEMFLHLGVFFCFAAGAPWYYALILIARKSPESLFWAANSILLTVVFELIAAFTSKGEVIPPCVAVTRPHLGRIARAAKEVASGLLMGSVFCFAVRGSLPSVGQMSGWDMVACGFFTMAVVIRGCHSLFRRFEICGNGLWDGVASHSTLRSWEAFESCSWTGTTTDGVELKLQPKSADQRTTWLAVRPEDFAVVQQILQANVPEQLWGAHAGLNRRNLPPCVRVRRTRRRRLAWQTASVLCWPTVVLLLVYLWERSASLETFSGVGVVSIMITEAINFWPSKNIEICRNGLLLDDKLRTWERYECFFWKGETEDGVEVWLQARAPDQGTTRLTVRPEDRETVQQLLEAKLRDRSTDSAEYSGWSLF
jgi:hypothetical protein